MDAGVRGILPGPPARRPPGRGSDRREAPAVSWREAPHRGPSDPIHGPCRDAGGCRRMPHGGMAPKGPARRQKSGLYVLLYLFCRM